MSEKSNGQPIPSAEELAGLAAFGLALKSGSATMCQVLAMFYPDTDLRLVSATQADNHMESLVALLGEMDESFQNS